MQKTLCSIFLIIFLQVQPLHSSVNELIAAVGKRAQVEGAKINNADLETLGQIYVEYEELILFQLEKIKKTAEGKSTKRAITEIRRIFNFIFKGPHFNASWIINEIEAEILKNNPSLAEIFRQMRESSVIITENDAKALEIIVQLRTEMLEQATAKYKAEKTSENKELMLKAKTKVAEAKAKLEELSA